MQNSVRKARERYKPHEEKSGSVTLRLVEIPCSTTAYDPISNTLDLHHEFQAIRVGKILCYAGWANESREDSIVIINISPGKLFCQIKFLSLLYISDNMP